MWAKRLIVAAAIAIALPATALSAAPNDAWITTKTKLTLFTSEGVSGSAINVDTVDGRVTLHGSVSSEAEKSKAAELARSVSGVKDVRNLLQVVPKQAQKETEVADNEIEKNVKAALKNDPDLHHSSVSVQSVNRGVVLLAGKTNSLS